MVTKDELKRRVRLAKYRRRGAAVFEGVPDHNPLILEDCHTCHGRGRCCEETTGCAVLTECPDCAGSGTTGEVVRYFANDAPSQTVRLGADGWLTCPCCGRRFSPRDRNVWTGLRHIRCGQRLVLDGT